MSNESNIIDKSFNNVTAFSIEEFLRTTLIKEERIPSYVKFLTAWGLENESDLSLFNEDRLKIFALDYKSNPENKDFVLLPKDLASICEVAQSYVARSKEKRKLATEETIYEKYARLKQSHPKFTVNGEIKDPTGFFFLQPEATNKQLIESIQKGDYIMLQGHRGSGKSTRCLYAIENQLSDFACIWVTMQSGILIDNEENFWNSFGSSFMSSLKTFKIPTNIVVKDSHSFVEFFREQRTMEIVLFLDEFDLMLHSNAAILESLLGTLRAMKSNRGLNKEYHLQSVIVIGPFSILQAANKTLSPFNVTESIESPYFKLNDVVELFAQFTKATQVTLEDGIIEDIYARTRGHPGLTCFCGKRIHEDLSVGKSFVSLATWLDFAIFILPLEVPFSWATVGRLKETIAQEPNSTFILRNFLCTDLPLAFHDDKDKEMARLLTSEGVLRHEGNNTFVISSPLIRAIVFNVITSRRELQHPIPQYMPYEGSQLNVAQLVIGALLLFDRQIMVNAVATSYKDNECSGSVKIGAPVPKEHCYQVELYHAIRKWLPSKLWILSPEANAPSQTKKFKPDSCDIIIGAWENQSVTKRYAIELVAHARDSPSDRPGTVEEHFARAESSYSKIKGVTEVWVINFCTRPFDKDAYVWPSKESRLRVMHIYHSLNWKKATVVVDSHKEEPTVVKLACLYGVM